jgi:phosphomannomutase
MNHLNCFKAYDIRGKVPQEFSPELAYQIAYAFVKILDLKHVVLGRDCRLESPLIATAITCALIDAGVKVRDIGLCGTEEVYFHCFAAENLGIDGGIMVTASHNPKGYNGMKLVGPGAMAISGDNYLPQIKRYVEENAIIVPKMTPSLPQDFAAKSALYYEAYDKEEYVQYLLRQISVPAIKDFTIVTNSGNGMAGLVVDLLEQYLPCKFIKLNNEPNGYFPKGVPNPMLAEQGVEIARVTREEKADLGIAWDGDFDRCFLFDHAGNFINGYYLVGLLAEYFLQRESSAKIIYDTRLVWNTQHVIENNHGIPLQNKAGHSFLKQRMRCEDAVYGGEISSHHYFRDFGYCDSGMLPFLIVLEIMSHKDATLAEMLCSMQQAFPASSEMNYVVQNPGQLLIYLQEKFASEAVKIDHIDGLSMEFAHWRFNLRPSNTEALIRLNIEARENAQVIQEKLQELESIIKNF